MPTALSYDIVAAATREVLQTSAAASVDSVDHVPAPDASVVGVLATMSLLGTRGGTLVACCSAAVGEALCAAMLGGDAAESEETVRDTIGELLNQIAGTLKRRIGATAEEILLSPPVVVCGQPLSHSVKAAAAPIAVVASLPAGSFGVSFWQATA